MITWLEYRWSIKWIKQPFPDDITNLLMDKIDGDDGLENKSDDVDGDTECDNDEQQS